MHGKLKRLGSSLILPVIPNPQTVGALRSDQGKKKPQPMNEKSAGLIESDVTTSLFGKRSFLTERHLSRWKDMESGPDKGPPRRRSSDKSLLLPLAPPGFAQILCGHPRYTTAALDFLPCAIFRTDFGVATTVFS